MAKVGKPHYYGKYNINCYDKDGNLKWNEKQDNLVVNQGLNHALCVITATAHVSSWYVGIGTTGFAIAATDVATTMGTRSSAFSEATLPAFTAGAIGATGAQTVSNQASVAAFSINAATTLGGAYLINSNVKAAASEGAILWGGATFSAARAVQNGDTLNVQITVGAEVT